jgi:hypothetical protein
MHQSMQWKHTVYYNGGVGLRNIGFHNIHNKRTQSELLIKVQSKNIKKIK